jgi:hypothetical protein
MSLSEIMSILPRYKAEFSTNLYRISLSIVAMFSACKADTFERVYSRLSFVAADEVLTRTRIPL